MGVKVSMSIPDGKNHISPGLLDQNSVVSLHHQFPKDAKIFLLKKKRKKKKLGGAFECTKTFLSRVTSIAKTFGRMWSFDTEIFAGSLIIISHMRSAINVYRICRSVKARDLILKHWNMLKKDVPMILRNTITSFLPSNRSKFKWTVYKRIRMGGVKPFSEQK